MAESRGGKMAAKRRWLLEGTRMVGVWWLFMSAMARAFALI